MSTSLFPHTKARRFRKCYSAVHSNLADDGSSSKSPSMAPTPYVVVSNMFNPEEETERNWDLDLAEDVKGEIEGKYGKLKRIKVDKMSAVCPPSFALRLLMKTDVGGSIP